MRFAADLPRIMIDGSLLPYEENVALTAEVVRLAHAVGVSVEGREPSDKTGTSVEGGVSQSDLHRSAQAADFITRTECRHTGCGVVVQRMASIKGMRPKLQMDILRDIAGRIVLSAGATRWFRQTRTQVLWNQLRSASAKSISPAI